MKKAGVVLYPPPGLTHPSDLRNRHSSSTVTHHVRQKKAISGNRWADRTRDHAAVSGVRRRDLWVGSPAVRSGARQEICL